MKKYNIAIIGATGNVGREILNGLEERNFPVNKIIAFASNESIGKSVNFKNETIKVDLLDHKTDFRDIDFAFFCAGSGVAQEYAEKALKQGAVVIDKSSFFRMADDVPLVVPEVNPFTLNDLKEKLISNPNCCVIPLAVALKPLDSAAKIKRLVISTYQSVSGAGKQAMDELYTQTKSKFIFGETKISSLPKQIAFNLFPQVGDFLENGDSDEEDKISAELKKILGNHISSSVTCVRVPVFVSHSISVNVEFENNITAHEAEEILLEESGIILNRQQNKEPYTTPVDVTGHNEVFVSRVRDDKSRNNAINLWICCDNLRKGAALNAIQIAELMIKN